MQSNLKKKQPKQWKSKSKQHHLKDKTTKMVGEQSKVTQSERQNNQNRCERIVKQHNLKDKTTEK